MDVREFIFIRHELGLTQKKLSQILCVSLKAIQSFEQSWRNIPTHIEREMLLLLTLKQSRNREAPLTPCWETVSCDENWRENCFVWKLQARRFCWYINGTFCFGKLQLNWDEKIKLCRKCKVFQNSLTIVQENQDDSPSCSGNAIK